MKKGSAISHMSGVSPISDIPACLAVQAKGFD